MLMLHVAPAATELPQVLLCRKSPGFAPPTAMLVMLSATVAVLVSVTFCAALSVCRPWLPNVRLKGESVIVGAEFVPVPVSVAGIGGTADALKLTLTVPVKVPVAAGAKLTLMAHVAPAATVAQLLVCRKSDGFAP
jgi:hypothetical protein